MDYTCLLLATAMILWMVLALLWEHRCKNVQRELRAANNKIEELEKKNRELKTSLFMSEVFRKAAEPD